MDVNGQLKVMRIEDIMTWSTVPGRSYDSVGETERNKD
jgi:hypothetical protein